MSDLFPKSIELKKRSLHERIIVAKVLLESVLDELPSVQPSPCEFCKHNNIADNKVCLMCSAERRTDE